MNFDMEKGRERCSLSFLLDILLYFSLLVEILGEDVAVTILVACLGCNFPHSRKGCRRFVFFAFLPVAAETLAKSAT